jgi:hypothetical protein
MRQAPPVSGIPGGPLRRSSHGLHPWWVVTEGGIESILEDVDPLAPLRSVGGRLAPPMEAMAQSIAERAISLVLDAVDVNAVLDLVDIEEILDRVDMNRLLARVDMNDIVERIDLEAIVEQTDLGSIIAKSSSGVASDAVDALRSRTVGIDESIARVVARLRRRPYTGPPGPPAGLRATAAS